VGYGEGEEKSMDDTTREWSFAKPKVKVKKDKKAFSSSITLNIGAGTSGQVFLDSGVGTFISTGNAGDVSITPGDGGKVYIDGDVIVRGALRYQPTVLSPKKREAASSYLRAVRGE
jgi:hypothetical protein